MHAQSFRSRFRHNFNFVSGHYNNDNTRLGALVGLVGVMGVAATLGGPGLVVAGIASMAVADALFMGMPGGRIVGRTADIGAAFAATALKVDLPQVYHDYVPHHTRPAHPDHDCSNVVYSHENHILHEKNPVRLMRLALHH